LECAIIGANDDNDNNKINESILERIDFLARFLWTFPRRMCEIDCRRRQCRQRRHTIPPTNYHDAHE